MAKFLAAILILLSIAGGAVFGWYRAGQPDILDRRRPPRPAPTPVKPVVEEVKAEEPERPSPPPPPTPSDPEELFAALRFDEAQVAYATLALRTTDRARRVAEKMEVLSEILQKATRHIPKSHGVTPAELTLANGSTIVGFVTEDDDGSVTLRTDQGISATFPAEEVRYVNRIGKAEWRDRCEKDLAQRLKYVSDELPALDYYQAAYFSIRSGLEHMAADILVQSSEAKGFPLVIETFGGSDAGRLVARWEEVRDPDRSAPEAVEPPPPPVAVKPPVEPDQPDRPPVDYSRAEGLYQEGLSHYRKSLPGMLNAEEELKVSRKLFEQALDAYNIIYESRPDDLHVDERIHALQTLLYDCIKRMKI